MQNVIRILQVDGTHVGASGMKKLLHIINDLTIYTLWSAAIFFLAYVIVCCTKKLGECLDVYSISIFLSVISQLLVWIVFNSGYEYWHIHIVTVLVLSMKLSRKKEAGDLEKAIVWLGIYGTLLSLIGISVFTNLTLSVSMVHAGVGILFAMIIYGKKKRSESVLICLCFLLIVGKAYTLRDSKDFNNVLQSKARIVYGPAKGCITNFQTAQVYNRNFEFIHNIDLEGENLLIVSTSTDSPMNVYYMFDKSNISHYSIINPSFYNEKLLDYWEMYPDKRPNVIGVECVEGVPIIDDNSWIMDYINQSFEYSAVEEAYFLKLYFN